MAAPVPPPRGAGVPVHAPPSRARVPQGLKGNGTLTEFSVAGNEITDGGLNALAGVLKTNRALHTLNIARNSVGGVARTANDGPRECGGGAEGVRGLTMGSHAAHPMSIFGIICRCGSRSSGHLCEASRGFNFGGAQQSPPPHSQDHCSMDIDSGAKGAENFSKFSPKTWQMMIFLNPLDALVPKIPFSFFAEFVSGSPPGLGGQSR